MEILENLGLSSNLRPFRREGTFGVHRTSVLGSRLKVSPIKNRPMTDKGYFQRVLENIPLRPFVESLLILTVLPTFYAIISSGPYYLYICYYIDFTM